VSEYRELSEEEEERYEKAYDLLKTLRGLGIDFRLVRGKVCYRPASRLSEVARAELEQVRDEVQEILLEEEEREAWWESRLANQPEMDPMPEEEYEELLELPKEQTDALFGWIAESIEICPEKSVERLRDSYSLKHVFERSPEGFYVTDGQFRAAMWISGFLGRRYPGRWYEDCESRYYYVRPNREGLIRKLEIAGVPSDWARYAFSECDHPGEAA